jgi:hypothetical protein
MSEDRGMKGLNHSQSVFAWPLGALLPASGKTLLQIRNSKGGNDHYGTSELCRLIA